MELATALSSARAALDLLQIGLKARDDAKVQEATEALRARLLDVTDRAMLFQDRNAALMEANAVQRDRIRDLERQVEDRARYALHELRPGAFAYALSPAHAGVGNPAHYLCQPCYDKGVKSMLRYSEGHDWVHGKWHCPEEARHVIDDTQPKRP